MKKRTFFAIVIAIIFMIVGGIGTFITQKKLVNEREKNTIHKKIKSNKNKTLDIHFNTPTSVTLTHSDNQYIYMDKQGVDFRLDNNKQADWTFKEEKNTSSLTINNPTTNKENPYPFAIFNINNYTDDTVYLRIPTHYETVTINGKNVNLSMHDFSMDNIKLNMENGSASLSGIRANQVSQPKQDTDFSLDDSKISEELSVNTKLYDINVLNTTAKLMTLTTDMGDVFTANTKGDLKITTVDGDISINHTTGKSVVASKHGDVLFHDNHIDFDTELMTTNGNIDIETDESSISDNKLDFETTLGDISIFNKNLSSNRKYKTNKGTISIKATSKNGEIEVEELDSDDTQYDYD